MATKASRCDIEPYREGNTGVPFVWSFVAEAPGPHVMINGLTHGNEPCGMRAVSRLLDEGVRPACGRLTLALANVEAYGWFQPGLEDATRYLDRDLNRVWRDDWIDADRTSREAARARALRPFLDEVDILLDLHSTAFVATPFWVLAEMAKTRELADALAFPAVQQLMPGGCAEGRHMVDYGRFARPDDPAVGLVVECGRHADPSSAEVAWRAALRLLSFTGLAHHAEAPNPAASLRRYRVTGALRATTDRFRLRVPAAGFVAVRRGTPIAHDGPRTVLADRDGVILSPRPRPRAGEIVFHWGEPVEA